MIAVPLFNNGAGNSSHDRDRVCASSGYWFAAILAIRCAAPVSSITAPRYDQQSTCR